jgi:hypothetical protein
MSSKRQSAMALPRRLRGSVSQASGALVATGGGVGPEKA